MGDAEADQHMANLQRIHQQYYHYLMDSVNEGADNLGGWKKKTARDVERIQKLQDKEQRTAKPGQLRKPNTATQRKVYTNPKNLDYLASLGTGKYTVKESGETYVWTAEFADGSREQLTMATDEVPYAKAAFEKKFPNKQLTKVDTDWIPQSDGYRGLPTSKFSEPRPSPDNPMVRESTLAETVAEIEEDMLSRVKRDLTTYLDRLEKKIKPQHGVVQIKSQEPDLKVDEDPTAIDLTSTPPQAPMVNPTLPEATVKSVAFEDGCVLEIYGNETDGFGIRRHGKELGQRFPKLDHAEMAIDLYRARRPQDLSQDYVDER